MQGAEQGAEQDVTWDAMWDVVQDAAWDAVQDAMQAARTHWKLFRSAGVSFSPLSPPLPCASLPTPKLNMWKPVLLLLLSAGKSPPHRLLLLLQPSRGPDPVTVLHSRW